MTTRTALALPVILLLTAAPAALGDPLPPTPAYDAESPEAAAGQRLCSAAGDLCARFDVTATLRGCVPAAGALTCTALYTGSLEVDGSRAGCASGETGPTGHDTGCVILTAVPYATTPPLTGERTYAGLAPGDSIREKATVCVDALAPTAACRDFFVTLRLPTQRTLYANATTTSPQPAAQASVTLCTDPAEASHGQGCSTLDVTARPTGCTGTGASRTCTVEYELILTSAGVDLCSRGAIAGATILGCAITTPNLQRVAHARTYAPATDGAIVHEDGTYCINATFPGERCVAFGMDVPVE